MGDNRRYGSIATAVVAAALLFGAGIAIGHRIGDEGARAARSIADGLHVELESARAEISRLRAESRAANPSTQSVPPQAPSPSVAPSSAVEKPASEQVDGRFFSFLMSVKSTSGGYAVVADYARFLNGDEAAKAAARAGEESPPPNDYFIVNDNERLRTLMVGPSVRVTLATYPGKVAMSYPVTFARFRELFARGDEVGPTHYRSVPYWLTVQNGVVTRIEEQYLP